MSVEDDSAISCLRAAPAHRRARAGTSDPTTGPLGEIVEIACLYTRCSRNLVIQHDGVRIEALDRARATGSR